MKFLVADDSRLSRRKLTELIRELGYEVVGEAVDGLDAIEKFKELRPTFITMDLEMPNLKGTEASVEILKIDPNIKIILATTVVDKKEILVALKNGVKTVLQKPVTLENLSVAIEGLK